MDYAEPVVLDETLTHVHCGRVTPDRDRDQDRAARFEIRQSTVHGRAICPGSAGLA
ncbi:hypothetical protein P3T39_002643 [Kitasatospora sp. GP82]|nr:hypothetical protein [Kitasatospora sp. GP82]